METKHLVLSDLPSLESAASHRSGCAVHSKLSLHLVGLPHMAVAEPQASTCLGWWAETPAKLSLSTERLAKTDDAARRDEAERGRGGSTNDQRRISPADSDFRPNRPRKRTAGAFPSCPLAEPGVEIMAQTREGPPSPPASFPIHLFDALPLGRFKERGHCGSGLCKKVFAQGKDENLKGPGTPSFVRRLFWDRLLFSFGLDSCVDDAHPPATLDFFGHLIISDQSCHPQGLNPELSTDSCSDSARKHTPQNLTPNQLPRDLAPKHNGW